MRIARVLAPNPGPFTGPGTNTYVVGDSRAALVLDPGPLDRSHEVAIMTALEGLEVVSVVVTHTHSDHAPLANPLARNLGVPSLGYAPGPDFEPDDLLRDGALLAVGTLEMSVVYTPGHSNDHVCFLAEGTLFTGDHIMGGSSVMITDLASYMGSLERVKEINPRRILPGHGEPIESPAEVVSWYIAHRLQRESEILAAVRSGCATVGAVVETVYADVDPSLYPLASESVTAHLEKLGAEGLVRFELAGGGDVRVEAVG